MLPQQLLLWTLCVVVASASVQQCSVVHGTDWGQLAVRLSWLSSLGCFWLFLAVFKDRAELLRVFYSVTTPPSLAALPPTSKVHIF